LNDGLAAALRAASAASRRRRQERRRTPVRAGLDLKGWAFSYSTVEKIDDWYEALPDRWLREHLPARSCEQARATSCGGNGWAWADRDQRAACSAARGRAAPQPARPPRQRTETIWDDRILARSAPRRARLTSAFLRGLVPYCGLRARRSTSASCPARAAHGQRLWAFCVWST